LALVAFPSLYKKGDNMLKLKSVAFTNACYRCECGKQLLQPIGKPIQQTHCVQCGAEFTEDNRRLVVAEAITSRENNNDYLVGLRAKFEALQPSGVIMKHFK
jgi:hypothetical protein